MTLKLASGSYDNTIRFWDPSTGSSNSSEMIRLSGAPNRIEITEDKSKVVVGMNNCVKVYDLNKPEQPIRSFESDFKGNVTAVGCFWKQEKYIFTACEDGFLRVFDIKSKAMAKSIKHIRPISCAVLHPNESSLLMGDEAGLFVDWDLSTEKDKGKLDTNYYGIRSITISQNGEQMVIADSNGELYPYVYEHYVKGKSIKAHEDYILKVQLSPNSKLLATCAADKKIKLYKVVTEGPNIQLVDHKVLKGHLRWVWDCQFSCDSAYLISCSTDQTIKLWDVEKGELVQTLKGHEKGVVCLALNDIAEP